MMRPAVLLKTHRIPTCFAIRRIHFLFFLIFTFKREPALPTHPTTPLQPSPR